MLKIRTSTIHPYLRSRFRSWIVRSAGMAIRCWWPFLKRFHRTPRRRRVLVVAHNDLMATCCGLVADLIRDDLRLQLRFTGPLAYRHYGPTAAQMAQRLGLRRVSYLLARLRWWDVVLLADTHLADMFHPEIPKVLVNHSIACGKRVQGVDYRYEYSALRDGRPRFARILEASEDCRQRAIEANPVLTDAVVAVGDLRCDQLLALRSQRDATRQRLGFGPDQTVVLMMSTWGSASLMETVGKELIEQARRLMDECGYRFILSTHPNHWQGDHAVRQPWGEFLLRQRRHGFHVIGHLEGWERYMIASDLAVTDHTSLAVTYAQLGRPMLFVPVREEKLLEGSHVQRLYEACPRIDTPTLLEPRLEQAQRTYPSEQLGRIAHSANAYPGEASWRVREQIYEVLGLPQPGGQLLNRTTQTEPSVFGDSLGVGAEHMAL